MLAIRKNPLIRAVQLYEEEILAEFAIADELLPYDPAGKLEPDFDAITDLVISAEKACSELPRRAKTARLNALWAEFKQKHKPRPRS
jgi:hypothetical protein